jgi:GNAT superfamily N-acetyltransferase
MDSMETPMRSGIGTAAENGPWSIESAHPAAPEAAAVLRAYLAELIGRVHGGETDEAEIDRHLRAGHDSDDLVAPTGVLLLARRSGTVLGCVGLRRVDAETLELTRMFVRPEVRGEGVATRLLAAAESHARGLGARSIRLNTRADLVEARALYAKHGYLEVPRFGDDPFAELWFAKRLDGRPDPD